MITVKIVQPRKMISLQTELLTQWGSLSVSVSCRQGRCNRTRQPDLALRCTTNHNASGAGEC